MFVLYCPGKLLLGAIGAVGPPAQAPSAAPGALKRLGKRKPKHVPENQTGASWWELCPLFFPAFGGPHPLLQVKYRGIRHELGARGKVISQDIPYPKTLPR